jgi:1-aminocyclopropane-1-carboxylate deaminase
MLALTPSHITLDNISHLCKGNEVSILRLDKLHPVISGNKWYKLRYYLEEAIAQHKKGIVTFGGAWSNHILATAAACQLQGLASIGIIRGEEPADWSSTLLQAKELGMQFIFISREEYRDKKLPDNISGDYYVVNEGGYGKTGAKGAADIIDGYNNNFTHYCCAVGTGTMIAGLINAAPEQKITGISVMKNNRQLPELIQTLVQSRDTEWEVLHDYHFGGYAKYEPRLLQFMNDFYRNTGIPSDFVYTGKLFYAVNDLIEKNYFPANSKILVVHSGGLQGNASLHKGTLMF